MSSILVSFGMVCRPRALWTVRAREVLLSQVLWVCSGLVVGSTVDEVLAVVALTHCQVIADLPPGAGGVWAMEGGGRPRGVVGEGGVVLWGGRECGCAVQELMGRGGVRVPV